MFEIIRIDIFRLDLRVALARTVSLQLRLTIFHAIGRNAVHGKTVGECDLAAIGCDAQQFFSLPISSGNPQPLLTMQRSFLPSWPRWFG